MMPLENGPFYACRQYVGAYGTFGGVLIAAHGGHD